MPETWPKRFLVFSIAAADASARSELITVHDGGYESAQDFAESWFEDDAVLRIYELRQMFGIGRRRGE